MWRCGSAEEGHGEDQSPTEKERPQKKAVVEVLVRDRSISDQVAGRVDLQHPQHPPSQGLWRTGIRKKSEVRKKETANERSSTLMRKGNAILVAAGKERAQVIFDAQEDDHGSATI